MKLKGMKLKGIVRASKEVYMEFSLLLSVSLTR
jgi:hypothetical protein